MFYSGFVFADYNECSNDNGGCNHTCTNFVGGFNCSCNDGFQLMNDKKACKRKCKGTYPGHRQEVDTLIIYQRVANCEGTFCSTCYNDRRVILTF